MGAIERIRAMQGIIISSAIIFLAVFALYQVYIFYYVSAPKNKKTEQVIADGIKGNARAGELTDRADGVKAQDGRSRANTEAALQNLKSRRDALLSKMSELKKDQHLHVKDMIKRLEEEGYKIEDF